MTWHPSLTVTISISFITLSFATTTRMSCLLPHFNCHIDTFRNHPTALPTHLCNRFLRSLSHSQLPFILSHTRFLPLFLQQEQDQISVSSRNVSCPPRLLRLCLIWRRSWYWMLLLILTRLGPMSRPLPLLRRLHFYNYLFNIKHSTKSIYLHLLLCFSGLGIS